MKLKALLIALLFLSFNESISQEKAENLEKIKVEKVIKGYIENFFINDYAKMEVFLHERLAKRGVNSDGKLSPDYSKLDLKELMSSKRAFPLKHQWNKVRDIKINNRVATAILETGYPKTRWIEYVHLVKLNSKWVILDVVWCFNKILN